MDEAKSEIACAVSKARATVRVSREQAAMAMLDSVGSNIMRHQNSGTGNGRSWKFTHADLLICVQRFL